MYLCSEGHEEICHESRRCPVCDRREEIDQLEREVERLEVTTGQNWGKMRDFR